MRQWLRAERRMLGLLLVALIALISASSSGGVATINAGSAEQAEVRSTAQSTRALVKPLSAHGPFRLPAQHLRRLPDGLPGAAGGDEELDAFGGACEGRVCEDSAPSDSILVPPALVRARYAPKTTWIPSGVAWRDPQIAASRTHVVVTQWNLFGFYTKAGTKLQVIDAEAFFAPLLPDVNANLNIPADLLPKYSIDRFFDSRVLFDPFRDRFWIITMAKQTTTDEDIASQTDADLTYRRDKILVAVSTSEDPLDDWLLYWWDAKIDDGACNAPDEPPSTFLCPNSPIFRPGDTADYSTVGISQQYFLQSNKTNRYTYLAVADADDLAAGVGQGQVSAWQYGCLGMTQGPDDCSAGTDGGVLKNVLQPVHHHGGVIGGLTYLVSLNKGDDDHVIVWSLTGAGAPPALARTAIPVAERASPSPVDQMGAPPGITNPHQIKPGGPIRAAYRAGHVYASWQDCRQWVGATTCVPAVRLVRINLASSVATIDRRFGKRNALDDPAGAINGYLWPGVDVNGNGDMVVVYQRSGAGLWPEARYSVWPAGDPDILPSYLLRAGSYPFGGDIVRTDAGPAGRIDTAGIAVDPFDDEAVWMVHGYARKQNNASGTYTLVVGKALGDVHPELYTSDECRATLADCTITASLGSDVPIVFSVHNEGDGAAEPELKVQLVGGHQPPMTIATTLAPELAPGETVDLIVSATIPLAASIGKHSVRVTVDPADAHEEYDETNNVAILSRPLVVTP